MWPNRMSNPGPLALESDIYATNCATQPGWFPCEKNDRKHKGVHDTTGLHSTDGKIVQTPLRLLQRPKEQSDLIRPKEQSDLILNYLISLIRVFSICQSISAPTVELFTATQHLNMPQAVLFILSNMYQVLNNSA